MDQGTSILIQIVGNFVIGGVFVWAWAAERKERQELLKQFAERLDSLSKDYLGLLREMWTRGLPSLPVNVPMTRDNHENAPTAK
ncbi:MAG: hypothetical protein IT322_19895 [Anaerolineae bacterium]|nr:hypothetical protein [Anaerolineae bacterium]CAG1013083.1 hypothetical protein ANRL4_04833 [Anaerolineae bacterium]